MPIIHYTCGHTAPFDHPTKAQRRLLETSCECPACARDSAELMRRTLAGRRTAHRSDR